MPAAGRGRGSSVGKLRETLRGRALLGRTYAAHDRSSLASGRGLGASLGPRAWAWREGGAERAAGPPLYSQPATRPSRDQMCF